MSTCARMRKMGWTYGTDTCLKLSMQRELILVCLQSLRNTGNKEELLLPKCRGSSADKG